MGTERGRQRGQKGGVRDGRQVGYRQKGGGASKKTRHREKIEKGLTRGGGRERRKKGEVENRERMEKQR
jgi:hypothetical protein